MDEPVSQTAASRDVNKDRDIGGFWEERFCLKVLRRGWVLTRNQRSKVAASVFWYVEDGKRCHGTRPDVDVWPPVGLRHPEAHEVKHKSPTKNGCFGLEKYRFDDLVRFARFTGLSVYYTLHNSARLGRESKIDVPQDWLTINVLFLEQCDRRTLVSPSYVGGEIQHVPTYYWSQQEWELLDNEWDKR